MINIYPVFHNKKQYRVSHKKSLLMLEFATGKLWDKAEELESILEDNNIDHESLSYPMDYHDLEDLRDEYKSLLEESNIDY